MNDVSWGRHDDTARVGPPADPWAHAAHAAPPRAPGRKRKIFGRVYEVFVRGQRPGEHVYVGKTEQTLHQRVHGPNGHTSPASIAKDPWKAGILPGAAGYRLLENVYDTGDPAENDRALRRAEAFWIDRLRSTRNTVRPVRPPASERAPRRKAPGPRALAERKRARRTKVRSAILLMLFAVFTWLAARVAVGMEMESPAFPWVASPMVGGMSAWFTFWYVHRAFRRLTR